MDGVVDPPKVERNVQLLATWDSPPLVLRVVNSSAHSSIDSIREFARDLGESEPCVDDRYQPTFGSTRDDGLDLDDFPIWTDDSAVFVGEDLPVLIRLETRYNQHSRQV